TPVGVEHVAVPRPGDLVERPATVVADERRAHSRTGRVIGPLRRLALRAPLTHPGEIRHHVVDEIWVSVDHRVHAFRRQPPPSLAHVLTSALGSVWDALKLMLLAIAVNQLFRYSA